MATDEYQEEQEACPLRYRCRHQPVSFWRLRYRHRQEQEPSSTTIKYPPRTTTD